MTKPRCDHCGKFCYKLIAQPHKTQWEAMHNDHVMLCPNCDQCEREKQLDLLLNEME